MAPVTEDVAPAPSPLQWLLTALLLATIWWILSGGEPGSWVVGLPTVAAATWFVLKRRAPRRPLSALALLRFIPRFLWESVRGGIDVTSRVVRPQLRVAPGFVEFTTRLPAGMPQLLFLHSISLLPGTLAAELKGQTLRVHCLDREGDVVAELRRLESWIEAIFPSS